MFFAAVRHDRPEDRLALTARTALGRGGPLEIPAVLLGWRSRPRRPCAWPVVDRPGPWRLVVDALSERVAARVCEPLGFRRVPGSLLPVHKLADVAALEPG